MWSCLFIIRWAGERTLVAAEEMLCWKGRELADASGKGRMGWGCRTGTGQGGKWGKRLALRRGWERGKREKKGMSFGVGMRMIGGGTGGGGCR